MQPTSAHPTLIARLTRPFKKRLGADAVPATLPGPPGRTGQNDRRRNDRRKDERRRDESVLIDAHGSLRCGNPNRSLRVLVEWLASRGDTAEDYAWLCSRIASWGDARYINHLAQVRISSLLALKRNEEVLELMVQRLTADRTFRPKTSADTLKVAQLAAQSGHSRVSKALLSDFAARFKGDPRIPVAYALKQQLGAAIPPKESTA